jgi:all-trans-retinol 13,14-reductase
VNNVNIPKKKPWSKTAPDEKWDYLVIGSGMGGMTTAALLSKLGKRVLVLEQHYVAGGFTHMFKRPGYQWDVGVHAVGEVTEHSLPGRVLNRLTDGKLQWASLGPVYDAFHFPDEFRIDFPDTPRQFRENLLEKFPNERDAIDGYLGLVREVSSGMRPYYLSRLTPAAVGRLADPLFARRALGHMSTFTGDALGRLTRNEKLRTVFAAQWGYYGAVPSRSSFAMQALVAKHFLHGGYYPKGGAKRIAETLLGTVAQNGGWTRIGADVAEILVENGRAVGVRLKDGEVIRAKRVVSGVGARPTVTRLLPEAHKRDEWAQAIAQLKPAPAHVCLYIGFKGDIRNNGASAANQWFYNTWSTEADNWNMQGDAPVLYCSFPSLKDPEHTGENHTGEVVTFVPWSEFAPFRDQPWKRRGEDYDALKKRLTASLLEQFLQRMPGLRGLVDYVELSTPVSTDHFCRPASGSIYGLEPVPARFQNRWLRPRTPIRDLFLSGSDVASVGVIGAMMGGLLCAAAAEPVGSLRYLRAA